MQVHSDAASQPGETWDARMDWRFSCLAVPYRANFIETAVYSTLVVCGKTLARPHKNPVRGQACTNAFQCKTKYGSLLLAASFASLRGDLVALPIPIPDRAKLIQIAV